MRVWHFPEPPSLSGVVSTHRRGGGPWSSRAAIPRVRLFQGPLWFPLGMVSLASVGGSEITAHACVGVWPCEMRGAYATAAVSR